MIEYGEEDLDRLPGEVIITPPEGVGVAEGEPEPGQPGEPDYDYDPYEYSVNYDLNLDYDPVSDPDQEYELFDPYEELEKKEEVVEEDTMIIQSDADKASFTLNHDNYQESDAYYDDYDVMDSTTALTREDDVRASSTNHRKRRHKSAQHFARKNVTHPRAASSDSAAQADPQTLGPSDTAATPKRSKTKSKGRLQELLAKLAVT